MHRHNIFCVVFRNIILDNYWIKSSLKLIIMSIKSESALIFLLIILKWAFSTTLNFR